MCFMYLHRLPLTAMYKVILLVIPRFTDDELGFGENPSPESDRKQGWHSNLGCLILKCVLAPHPCA